MRISELSRRSGVSTATIKYYVREGLLEPGTRTGYNQTEYGEGQLSRLRLIRALVEGGGLSIASIRAVLAIIDDERVGLAELFGNAQLAGSHAPKRPPAEPVRERVLRFVGERGWNAYEHNPGIAMVASALESFEAIGRPDLAALLDAYAEAAEAVAKADLQLVSAGEDDRERMAETVVVGTVLGDLLFAGLRRIAQDHETCARFPPDEDKR